MRSRHSGKFVAAILVGLFVGCCSLGCGPTELTGGGTVITACRRNGDGGAVGSCGIRLRPLCVSVPGNSGDLSGVCCEPTETDRQCLVRLVGRGAVTPPSDHDWSRSCSTRADCARTDPLAFCSRTVCSRFCVDDSDCGMNGICVMGEGGMGCAHRCNGTNPISSCGVTPATPTAVLLLCVPINNTDSGTRKACLPYEVATP